MAFAKGGWRVGVLALIVGAGLGGGAGFYLASPPQPSFVASGREQERVDVTSRLFDDERSVKVKAHLAAEWKGLSPSGGVVRRADCETGAAFTFGEAPFMVDDRPVVLLRLSTPPWRDIWPTMRGPDVKAMQKALRNMGHADVPTDGYFGPATSRAVRSLWEGLGGDPKQNWVPMDQVIWLPRRTYVVASCRVAIGQRVSEGDPLFAVGGGLESLTAELPSDVAVGPRVAVLDEVEAPVDSSGEIEDPEFLARYTDTRSFSLYTEDPSAGLTVVTRLAEPLMVAAVPPSSLYGLEDESGCLADESGPLRVSVVASQLGETFVSSQTLPRRVLVNPGGEAPCG